jgi:hypothetical protein
MEFFGKYKKFWFIRKDSIDDIEEMFSEEGLAKDEVIILDDTSPISALISSRKRFIADYDKVLTARELQNYLKKSDSYLTENRLIFGKAKGFGKFRLFKSEELGIRLLVVAEIIFFEIIFFTFLMLMVLSKDKREDFFSLLLEITGTTLTFFFSFSYIEKEDYSICTQELDKQADLEIDRVNRFMSAMGFVFFIVGFFCNCKQCYLNNLIIFKILWDFQQKINKNSRQRLFKLNGFVPLLIRP